MRSRESRIAQTPAAVIHPDGQQSRKRVQALQQHSQPSQKLTYLTTKRDSTAEYKQSQVGTRKVLLSAKSKARTASKYLIFSFLIILSKIAPFIPML